jgi:hypothetical protein
MWSLSRSRELRDLDVLYYLTEAELARAAPATAIAITVQHRPFSHNPLATSVPLSLSRSRRCCPVSQVQ